MNCDYPEIVEAMGAPKWWNEVAAPRYVEFNPAEAANIYASEVCLALIACQSCGHRFRVCFSEPTLHGMIMGIAPRLVDQIDQRLLHYGDPPNVRCCPAGPTMNSEMLRVLEYWHRSRQTGHNWERDTAYEVEFEEDPT